MWAVLGLDISAVIFWLSTMATLAAFRAIFTTPVTISSWRRDLDLVATNGYLAILVATAVVSAIEM